MITKQPLDYAYAGFSMVSAIFILVILSLAGAFASKIISRLSSSNEMSINGQRAYYAAKSGLEWALYQVTTTPASCPATTTLSFTQVGLNHFQALVTCTAASFTEGAPGGTTYNIFTLTSVGSRGAATDDDYVTRTMITQAAPAAP